MKNDPIETTLARLDEVPLHTPEGRRQIEKALTSKYNLVVAKAAKVAANANDAEWTGLGDSLAVAFDRIINAGNAADKGCTGKIALARALVGVEYDNATVWLRGMKHVQMEPSWGGSIDTAAELRAVCAMGLVNSSARSKLSPLVDLLADPEWIARSGAARAIAALGSEAAVMVLKLKCLLGDKESEVFSDCCQGLLAADAAEGIPLVGAVARSQDEDRREAAILALGASRNPEAIEKLKDLFAQNASPKVRGCILLALATSRTEAAVAFILDLIRTGSASACTHAIAALGLCRDDPKFRHDVKEAIDSRADGAGREAFIGAFGA